MIYLLVYVGVPFCGCRWPSSMAEIRMGQDPCMDRYMPPVYYSAVDAIGFLIVFNIMGTGAFVVWLVLLLGSLPNMN